MAHKSLDPLIKGKNEVMRMTCRRVEDIFTGGMERFPPNKRNLFLVFTLPEHSPNLHWRFFHRH